MTPISSRNSASFFIVGDYYITPISNPVSYLIFAVKISSTDSFKIGALFYIDS